MVSRWISLCLLLSCFVLFAGFAIVLIDPLHIHLRNREQQRQRDVESIANSVVEYTRRIGSPPDFSDQFQQIGTLDQGCQLHTKYCQVTQDKCVNAHFILGRKDLSLPSDLQIGSYYKTGYAARYDATKEVVTVTSCGAETKEIIVTRSLHDVIKRQLPNAKK